MTMNLFSEDEGTACTKQACKTSKRYSLKLKPHRGWLRPRGNRNNGYTSCEDQRNALSPWPNKRGTESYASFKNRLGSSDVPVLNTNIDSRSMRHAITNCTTETFIHSLMVEAGEAPEVGHHNGSILIIHMTNELSLMTSKTDTHKEVWDDTSLFHSRGELHAGEGWKDGGGISGVTPNNNPCWLYCQAHTKKGPSPNKVNQVLLADEWDQRWHVAWSSSPRHCHVGDEVPSWTSRLAHSLLELQPWPVSPKTNTDLLFPKTKKKKKKKKAPSSCFLVKYFIRGIRWKERETTGDTRIHPFTLELQAWLFTPKTNFSSLLHKTKLKRKTCFACFSLLEDEGDKWWRGSGTSYRKRQHFPAPVQCGGGGGALVSLEFLLTWPIHHWSCRHGQSHWRTILACFLAQQR